MSAHVLLNLLIYLRKSGKMLGMSSILSLFRNEFNDFNNTSALSHGINIASKSQFWRENVKILPAFCNILMDLITKPVNHSWFIDSIA